MTAGTLRLVSAAQAPAARSLRCLQATLSSVGWEIEQAEIDLVAGRLLVEVHRFDGRWLYLHGDSLGRAVIERWQRESVLERVYGAGLLTERSRDQFLGRLRREGARDALRGLCSYIADNPAPGFSALPGSTVRDAFRPLMTSPFATLGGFRAREQA